MTTRDKGITLPLGSLLNVRQSPYNAKGDGINDDTTAIQSAIEVAKLLKATVFLPAGNYKTTLPLKLYGGVTLLGEGCFATKISKTTNNLGSGSSRARSGTITDTYVVDSIISIWHDDTATGTIYADASNIRNLGLYGVGNTYGVYAPRISQSSFEDLHIFNVISGWATYDGWMISQRRNTCQGHKFGWRWMNDGSGQGTGTSASLISCWNNFDNTTQQPECGFEFFGLTYSALIGCGVDNLIRTDNVASYCYSFSSCGGVSVTGSGAEGSRAGAIFASYSKLTFNNFRTYAMSANASWGTVGGIYSEAATISFIECVFEPYSPGTGIFNQVIQTGSAHVEINSNMPTGGNAFISYAGNSYRTVINQGKIQQLSANGTLNLVPATLALTYSASMTPDAAIASRFIISVTNNSAFTINAPTNPSVAQKLCITIKNTSGGALGAVTWNGIYKLAAWTQPANTFSRSIKFEYDGTNWVELNRTTADIPN